MIMYKKFKNFWKIVRKQDRSTIFNAGLITILTKAQLLIASTALESVAVTDWKCT